MATLDAIQARADAATEGPWVVPPYASPLRDEVAAPNSPGLTVPVCEVRSPAPNAEFIAHAREDVPKLVAALRAVEAVLAAEAKAFRETSDRLNQEVIDRHPDRDTDAAQRYDAYAGAAARAANKARDTIREALDG